MYFKEFLKSINASSDDSRGSAVEHVVEEVAKETYEEIPNTKVAEIIKEYHEVRVTDTLIESYLELASSNQFSVDPVICELRKYNKLDRIVEGKIHYTLNDNTVVAISEATQELLNKLLQGQTEIIDYMRESKEKFLHVIEQIGE